MLYGVTWSEAAKLPFKKKHEDKFSARENFGEKL